MRSPDRDRRPAADAPPHKTWKRFALFCLAAVLLLAATASYPRSARSIHEAVAAGRPAEVDACLRAGAEADGYDDRGRTPLIQAALAGNAAVVEQLLAGGADVNGPDALGYWTPLHAAARGGRPEVVALLLEKGADVNARDDGGRTPLAWAANDQVAQLLQERGGTR